VKHSSKLAVTAAASSTSSKLGRKSRRLGIVAGTLVAVMGSAVAFAAWTSSGTGSSQDVTAGTAASLAVSPLAGAVAGLVPGATKTSTFKVKNDNTYQVSLSAASVVSFTVTGGTGCTEANSGVTGVINSSAVGTPVAGGGAEISHANFTVAVSMTAASDNGCKGATFTPNLSVSGASS
jgi:hypothetical protein